MVTCRSRSAVSPLSLLLTASSYPTARQQTTAPPCPCLCLLYRPGMSCVVSTSTTVHWVLFSAAAVQEEPERLYDPNLTDSERRRQVMGVTKLSHLVVSSSTPSCSLERWFRILRSLACSGAQLFCLGCLPSACCSSHEARASCAGAQHVRKHSSSKLDFSVGARTIVARSGGGVKRVSIHKLDSRR